MSSERCDPPEDVANTTIAYINEDSSNVMVGDVVIYSCDPGMKLNGRSERFCLRFGNWSGSEPECVGKNDYNDSEVILHVCVVGCMNYHTKTVAR